MTITTANTSSDTNTNQVVAKRQEQEKLFGEHLMTGLLVFGGYLVIVLLTGKFTGQKNGL